MEGKGALTRIVANNQGIARINSWKSAKFASTKKRRLNWPLGCKRSQRGGAATRGPRLCEPQEREKMWELSGLSTALLSGQIAAGHRPALQKIFDKMSDSDGAKRTKETGLMEN